MHRNALDFLNRVYNDLDKIALAELVRTGNFAKCVVTSPMFSLWRYLMRYGNCSS